MIQNELRVELERLLATTRPRECVPAGLRHNGSIAIRGRTVADFANWDFFSLNDQEQHRRAVQREIERCGVSTGSSRLLSGSIALHSATERRLAAHLGAESALLFSSRNQALLSLVTTLCGERDLIYLQDTVQSPVVDAAYLVDARVESFRTLSQLEGLLSSSTVARRRFILLESLSGLTGNECDLLPYFALARRHQAGILLDESTALSTLGIRGAGGFETLAARNPVEPASALIAQVADLSLGLAASGAVVAGAQYLITLLTQRSRTLLVESAPSPAICAAIESAISLTELRTETRERLNAMAVRLKRCIPPSMLLSPIDSHGPIVAIGVARLSTARELAETLFLKGFLVDVLSASSELTERGVLRMLVNAAHTERHIEELVRALTELLPRTAEHGNE